MFKSGALLGFVISSSIATPAVADSAPAPSCLKALGKARAERISYHCWQVLGGMSHPPCQTDWDCPTLLESIDSTCKEQGVGHRIECQEGVGLLALSDRAAIERYGAAVTSDQAWATKARAKLQAVRDQVDPLLAQRNAASSALKAGQADFGKELKAANAAYDKYNAALKKPGAVGLDATRQALRAQLGALSSHGQALSKDAAALAALNARLYGLNSALNDLQADPVYAVQDEQSAAGVVAAMASQLDKKSSLAQADAASKQKLAAQLAASKAPDPLKLKQATADAAAAKARSNAALADAAAAKVINAQAAPILKAVVALGAEAARERQALYKLTTASSTDASAAKANQKLEVDRQQAQNKADEIDRSIQAVAARHRPNAPKAKGCTLEQVDFKNFAYPPTFSNNALDQYQNGNLVGVDWDESMRPRVDDVALLDLDGNGKKEAVVFIAGPPTAHSGNNNALYFFELDEQCRIQQLLSLQGPVSAGRLQGKSYFYGELELGTPQGMGGLFPVGNQRVELRYVNGELQEASRKNAPMQ